MLRSPSNAQARVGTSLAFLKDRDLDLFRAQDRDPERAHEPFIESYKAL